MGVTTISVPAARVAMAAVIIYQVILAALIFIRPDLDPSWHTISEWAIGPWGWLMSAGFMISAISYSALFVMLKSQVGGFWGYTGLSILGICIAGTFGVSIFTTDPLSTAPEHLSTIGLLHMISGGSALLLFPFCALCISLNLAKKNEAWKPKKSVLFWIAGVPLLGLIGFMTYHTLFVTPLGPYAYGPGVHIGWPPRFALLTYMIWVLVICRQAIYIHAKHESGF